MLGQRVGSLVDDDGSQCDRTANDGFLHIGCQTCHTGIGQCLVGNQQEAGAGTVPFGCDGEDDGMRVAADSIPLGLYGNVHRRLACGDSHVTVVGQLSIIVAGQRHRQWL